MRIKLQATIIISGLIFIIFPVFASANLILNGNFENGLNNWSTVGEVKYAEYFEDGFYSPGGDYSSFAMLGLMSNSPNAALQQIVDINLTSKYRLQMDFTLLTYDAGWGDDFRAELWINYPGEGDFTPIFSYGSDEGVFQDWGSPRGLKYYTVKGFTYDFYRNQPVDNLVLDLHLLDYKIDDNFSGMLVDNVSLTAIPEPGTLSLLILGFGFTLARFRRKK